MRRVLLFTCALLFCLPAQAQSPATVKDLEPFKDNVLTLRNFSRSDSLRFDENGIPSKTEESAPWALYSQFLVRTVDLNPKRAVFRGPRIISNFDNKARKMVQYRSNLLLEVTIDLKPNATGMDLASAMSSVFIRPEELRKRVPDYWKEYFQSGPKDPKTAADPATLRTVRDIPAVSGDVMAAKLVTRVIPKYPEDARAYRFEGYVMFRAEISEKGEVENLMILSPAGAGFDENAAEAVYKWKYKPQTVNGQPVTVVTVITVNYTFQR